MAIVHGSYRNIVNVDVCIESEPLKVQVPLTFSGTMSFPRHRDGRYFNGCNSRYRNSDDQFQNLPYIVTTPSRLQEVIGKLVFQARGLRRDNRHLWAKDDWIKLCEKAVKVFSSGR